ncbi:Uu.00g056510.m01.CDS01 [Anthostomella pinea]|uniref:Uu.00g056510.m01.CDS01 n=1 Tax=Anthostomella pinea TaxID=933095 RepID=A0AAI8YJN9_9PEZI|nr:Uu.00g056510.m01.CDS01 [Anthostomella pinea]
MTTDDTGREWALEVLRHSLRISRLPDEFSTSSDHPIRLDPERLQYIRELIAYILDGRTIAASYNLVLLAVLGLFVVHHIYQSAKDRSRWMAIERTGTDRDEEARKLAHGGQDGTDSSSSSSSTLEGDSTSQDSAKPIDRDLERQPLLGDRTRGGASSSPRTSRLDIPRSWLMYQPPPIPVVNRTLPSNGTSLFIVFFLGLNIFFNFYKSPLEPPRFAFAFIDRAGVVFVVNLPLLQLLAAKNQPLKLLTGRSYEALNIYHRRIGELMCLEALVHGVGMIAWRLWISPEWLVVDDLWHYFTHPLILLGLGAFVSYELLYFTSLGSFRERWYEVFLASHVILQIAGLAFLWFHFHTTRPYVYASLAIFFVDRLVWRLGIKSTTAKADLTILEDGETVLLSADWTIPHPQQPTVLGVFQRGISHGWHPADHVFVSIPSLGGSHRLQAHPFTIASAAPETSSAGSRSHAWLSLLIRVHSGFSSDLLRHAQLNSTVDVRFDGPYGSQDPLNMLRASENAVLIAGGSGIAVVLPLAWALARKYRGRRQVHLLWIIHSRTQRSWILPQERLGELCEAGVRVTIPEPTIEAGRPDIFAYVADLTATAHGEIGVVVSGPDGLNRSARNACARAVRSGAGMNLRVEKFGW